MRLGAKYRQAYLKVTALAGSRLHGDAALMQQNDPPAQGKPDAVSFYGSLNIAAPVEGIKNQFLLFRLYTHAIVDKRDIDSFVLD